MRLPSLLRRSGEKSSQTNPGFFDVDGIVYAIGDIHGKRRLLEDLLKRVRTDIESTPGAKTLVFMGDYVDRGEDSRGVLELVAGLEIPDCEVVCLRGNHEKQMLDFIDEPLTKNWYLNHGGVEAMESFGVPGVLPTASDDELIEGASAFADALGDLRRFIEEQTVFWHQVGNVVFSHAGMDPDGPIDQQNERMMLYGSKAFMDRGGPAGYWYVHGHVIQEKAGIFGNRIAVDTGAFQSGILTVARISDQGCAFLEQS